MISILPYAIAALLMLTTPVAFSEEWIPIGQDRRGDAWHVDRSSLAKEQELVLAWKRVTFKEPYPRIHKNAPVTTALFLDATDCTQGHVSVRAIKLLDGDDAVIASYDHDESGARWPADKSPHLIDKAVTFVCGHRF